MNSALHSRNFRPVQARSSKNHSASLNSRPHKSFPLVARSLLPHQRPSASSADHRAARSSLRLQPRSVPTRNSQLATRNSILSPSTAIFRFLPGRKIFARPTLSSPGWADDRRQWLPPLDTSSGSLWEPARRRNKSSARFRSFADKKNIAGADTRPGGPMTEK